MSQELAEGVHISTYAGRAATEAGPFHAFMLFGENVGEDHTRGPLHEATDAIYEITHAPDRFDDPLMSGLRGYVKGLNLQEPEGGGAGQGQNGRPLEVFRPSSRALEALRAAHAAADKETETKIDFLGTELDPIGFAILVDYLMTNTVLWSEDPKAETEDPRIAMVDRFRSGQ